MKPKETKNSNANIVLYAIILIMLIITFSYIGYYAWAKYTTSKPGEATAQVAKWHFDLTPGKEEDQTPRTNFAMTRTDGYGYVAQNKLAPGTHGIIPIEVDTTNTEVTMRYDIKVQIQNCPKNIIFYTDKANSMPLTKIEIDENTIELTISKYLSLADVNNTHDETIYWKWPYQTFESDGHGGQSSTNGDIQDTLDQGNEVSITITAIGTEVLEELVTLGESTIEVGDKVNYEIDENTTIKGIVVNKTDNLVEFMPVYTEEDVGVAEVNSNKITESYVGKARLVGSVRLGYKEGTTDTEQKRTEAIASWNNAEQLVNKEAKENYSLASRALTVEDVNRLVGYTPNPSTTQKTYSTTPTSSNIQRFIVDELTEVTTTNGTILATDLDGIDVGDTVIIGNTYGGETVQSVTMKCTTEESTNTYYYYSNSTTYLLSTYFSSTYVWLASCCLNFHSDYCIFNVRYCNYSEVVSNSLYNSSGGNYSTPRPVVPVVSLSSKVLVKTGETSGEWNIKK